MIEADYPPGTLIFVDNGYDRAGTRTPIRHKLAKVTHIVPTEPYLYKPIIAIDLSKIDDYVVEILNMKEDIEKRRETAWNEQESLRAAAVRDPVPRGGSPGFRPAQRTPQALAPLSDNARLERFQADRDAERADNVRLIREERMLRRRLNGLGRRVYDNNNPDTNAPPPVQMDDVVPMGRVLVPQGGRKSRRGRKSKKSRRRRSKKRRSRRNRRR